MHNAKIHIANATGTLTPHIQTIQSAFKRATKTCGKLLELDNIDVLCVDDPEATIPEIGMAGFTTNTHVLYLSLDPSKKLTGGNIYNTLCHEFHHNKRYYDEGYGNTLFSLIACEGLAVCFEEEVSNGKAFLPNYLKKQPYTTLMKEKAAPHFEDTDFNRYTWFIEDESKELPRWTGYLIGYHVVSRYLKAKNKKASELVLEPSDTILEFVRSTL